MLSAVAEALAEGVEPDDGAAAAGVGAEPSWEAPLEPPELIAHPLVARGRATAAARRRDEVRGNRVRCILVTY